MLHRKLLGSISIDNYIRRIQISKAQRPKFYEWDGTTIKSGNKKLLQKYINPLFKNAIIHNNGNVLPLHLKPEYVLIGFKGNKTYCNIHHVTNKEIDINLSLTEKQLAKPTKIILCIYGTNEKVIANETQAGKPKNFIINGNYIYNHTASPFTTGKVFNVLKKMYYKKFKSINKSKLKKFKLLLNDSYPLIIELEIQDTIKNKFDNTKNNIGRRWDVGNRADPYMKTFLDFISCGYEDDDNSVLLEPLIEDDDRLHLSSGNNVIFTPINIFETPKLIFKFYKDNRKVWKTILKEKQNEN